MAKQAKQKNGILRRHARHAHSANASVWACSRSPDGKKHIERTTNEFLQMQHGSLYPALHRLKKRGWVISKWETAPVLVIESSNTTD